MRIDTLRRITERFFFPLVLLAAASAGPAWAQTPAAATGQTSGAAPETAANGSAGTPAATGATGSSTLADPGSYVGAGLAAVISAFGAPLSVRSERGPQPSQDDVVFVYGGFELYWAADRVWQIGFDNGYGVALGDAESAVLAALGTPVFGGNAYLVFNLAGRSWPMRLTVLFDGAGKVRALYAYRSDL